MATAVYVHLRLKVESSTTVNLDVYLTGRFDVRRAALSETGAGAVLVNKEGQGHYKVRAGDSIDVDVAQNFWTRTPFPREYPLDIFTKTILLVVNKPAACCSSGSGIIPGRWSTRFVPLPQLSDFPPKADPPPASNTAVRRGSCTVDETSGLMLAVKDNQTHAQRLASVPEA